MGANYSLAFPLPVSTVMPTPIMSCMSRVVIREAGVTTYVGDTEWCIGFIEAA
jgi:hypothetical protein